MAQAAKTLARRENAFGGNGDDALAFQDMNDGGRIQAASATEKDRAFQDADIFHAVEAVFALRTLRNDEAEGLPGAKSGRRNADLARHFADAKKPLRIMRY